MAPDQFHTLQSDRQLRKQANRGDDWYRQGQYRAGYLVSERKPFSLKNG